MATRRERMRDWIEIWTNIAVLVGIIFLIIELKLNSDNLNSDNEWALLNSSNAIHQQIAQNPELASIMVKVQAKEALTDTETLQFEYLMRQYANQILTAYELHEIGLLNDTSWEYALNFARALKDVPLASSFLLTDHFPLALQDIIFETTLSDTQ